MHVGHVSRRKLDLLAVGGVGCSNLHRDIKMSCLMNESMTQSSNLTGFSSCATVKWNCF